VVSFATGPFSVSCYVGLVHGTVLHLAYEGGRGEGGGMGRVGVEEGWEFVGRVGECLGDVGVWESWVPVKGWVDTVLFYVGISVVFSSLAVGKIGKDSRKERTRRA